MKYVYNNSVKLLFGNSTKSETIVLAKLYACIIVGSIGFQRVSMLAIGSVRKGAVDDPRFHIFSILFHILALTV